jgi:hypothetical protein
LDPEDLPLITSLFLSPKIIVKIKLGTGPSSTILSRRYQCENQLPGQRQHMQHLQGDGESLGNLEKRIRINNM